MTIWYDKINKNPKKLSMVGLNEKLRRAAWMGSETELKAGMNDADCDVLPKDTQGMAALMYAAHSGHDDCVGFWLPVSDVWDKSKDGLTTSDGAKKRGHETLANFIDAYAWSQSERASIGVATTLGAPRGRAGRRG